MAGCQSGRILSVSASRLIRSLSVSASRLDRAASNARTSAASATAASCVARPGGG
eukprot:CAMPEP_0206837068 /NCGR_PEP_ID=MMETSP0975-20121206/20220_1 /ASSEMBLY_ACC=CAM_ASM_000399 /TAXON_ID=483370 /ORGANISM="non described non described, Strain CCMP2097" /LENGTH=54 /DNA_ID=CAMNT_0054379485 /DNA_START=71 /DNA_END=231 /DNA_ORIENTATION=-